MINNNNNKLPWKKLFFIFSQNINSYIYLQSLSLYFSHNKKKIKLLHIFSFLLNKKTKSKQNW